MNKGKTSINSLAKRIMIALVLGIIAGVGIIMLRENLTTSNPELWQTIYNLLFANISLFTLFVSALNISTGPYVSKLVFSSGLTFND